MYDFLIFDLDGTIADTKIGIYNSVRYAENQMGLTPVQEKYLKNFLGPPPIQVYQELYGVDQIIAKKAALYHREYGKKYGIFESSLYPMVKEILRDLKSKNFAIGLATLKSQENAELLLEFLNIKEYFNVVKGIDKEEALTKTEIITYCKKELKNHKKAVMFGDSINDAEGAEKAEIDFVGMLYGFGFLNEKDLKNYKCVGICNNFSDIFNFI